MKKILQSLLLLTSLLFFSQTQTDKLVQSAANYIKSENYASALSVLEVADQNDYRVSYLQIISKYAIVQNLEDATNAQASLYISNYGNKNSGYTNTISDILKRINNANPIGVSKEEEVIQESGFTEIFTPIKYDSDTDDFERINNKTKKLTISPDYSIIKNPKEVSEFLQNFEIKNGEALFKGEINFCHFYEIRAENKNGTGTRKMLDLRNGQIYDAPSKNVSCGKYELEEFVNNSNIYILYKCEDGESVANTYSWDEKSKKFGLIKTQAN